MFLLVVAPERATAAWADVSIPLGQPGFELRPIVVPFEGLPRIVDLEAAQRLPELAVLSAMAHPELEVAEVAIAAIAPLPEDEKRLYLDVILSELPAVLRQAMEARMIKGYEYQSDFARKYYGQGKQEGLHEGLQAAVLSLARAKLGSLSVEDETALRTQHDAQVLTALNVALGQAASAPDARVAFDAAVHVAPRA